MITITQKKTEPEVYRFKDLKPGDRFRNEDRIYGMIYRMLDSNDGVCFREMDYVVHHLACDAIVYPLVTPKKESPKTISFKDLSGGQSYTYEFGDDDIYIKTRDCSVQYVATHGKNAMNIRMRDGDLGWDYPDTKVYPVDLEIQVIGAPAT